jgi:hypothetical protein
VGDRPTAYAACAMEPAGARTDLTGRTVRGSVYIVAMVSILATQMDADTAGLHDPKLSPRRLDFSQSKKVLQPIE